MAKRTRIAIQVLVTALVLLPVARAQNTEFSWRFGPVDLNQGQTAKVIFANPFCPLSNLQLDVTLAITDLTGKIVRVRTQDHQTTAAKKRAIVNCNDSIQLEIAGEKLDQPGTVVGVMQLITDINGVPGRR